MNELTLTQQSNGHENVSRRDNRHQTILIISIFTPQTRGTGKKINLSAATTTYFKFIFYIPL